MTRSILTLTLCAAVLCPALAAGRADASSADRKILRNRLQFHYVANANVDPPGKAEVLNNADIMAGKEEEAFWSNSSASNLHSLVRGLLRDSGNGGDELLQYYAAQIVDMTPGKKPVVVIMFDDVSQQLTARDRRNRNIARKNWGGCIVLGSSRADENGRAWPCATDYENKPYAGMIWIGAYNMSGAWALSTFIHELAHTQDKSDGRAHLFHVGGKWYNYGADGKHYGTEVIPNLASAYKEGLANAMRLRYHPAYEKRYFDIFAKNGLLRVEKELPPWMIGKSTDLWLYLKLDLAGVNFVDIGDEDYAGVRFHDLPPKYMVHNEYLIAITIAEFLFHTHDNRFFDALPAANKKLFGNSDANGLAVLFDLMCTCGLPEGVTMKELVDARQNPAGPKPYVLPLAYLDYFTGYSAKSKDEFNEMFEGRLSEGWIELYWAERDAVRVAVPSPLGRTAAFSDLTDVALALDVNYSPDS